jgi:hypothetical protein
MLLLCLLGGGDGAATASVTSKWAPLRHLITEPKYLCWEWMARGYFAASTSTRMGHGNGSVTKGRVLGAAAFLLGLAGPLELEPGGY